jgi:esterase/lipase
MNKDGGHSSDPKYATMVGLFVASAAVNIFLKKALGYAHDKNLPEAATIIQNITPYVDTAFKLLNRLDSNFKSRTWEAHMDEKMSDIQTQIQALTKLKSKK